MRHEIKAGSWECFSGVKDMGDVKKSPIILCRPQGEPKAPYFIFYKDKVIVEKPEQLRFLDAPPVKIIKRIGGVNDGN